MINHEISRSNFWVLKDILIIAFSWKIISAIKRKVMNEKNRFLID